MWALPPGQTLTSPFSAIDSTDVQGGKPSVALRSVLCCSLVLIPSSILQVGKLRDEKKALQSDIAELMAVRPLPVQDLAQSC